MPNFQVTIFNLQMLNRLEPPERKERPSGRSDCDCGTLTRLFRPPEVIHRLSTFTTLSAKLDPLTYRK